jgi:hypothetical protein
MPQIAPQMSAEGDTGWEDKPQLRLLPTGENQVLECYSELDLLSMSLLSSVCYIKNLACLLYQKP